MPPLAACNCYQEFSPTEATLFSLPQTSESFMSLCLSLETLRAQRDDGAQSLTGETYLLQSVVRGVAEATGAALQPAGPRHGFSLLVQQGTWTFVVAQWQKESKAGAAGQGERIHRKREILRLLGEK